jgi:serine/threonine protein kinase
MTEAASSHPYACAVVVGGGWYGGRSLGVIVFILLSGYPPFYGETDAEIFKAIRRGAYTFPTASPAPAPASAAAAAPAGSTGAGAAAAQAQAQPQPQPQQLLSAAARDFVSRLLLKDWKKRMSVSEALAHPWIADAKLVASDQYVRACVCVRRVLGLCLCCGGVVLTLSA